MNKLIFSAIILFLLSSCTAVGYVADLVIINTVQKDVTLSDVLNDELVLTQLGNEIDSNIIANLKGTSSASGKNKASDPSKQFYGVCNRELKKDEVCYTAEYYEQFRKD